MTTRKITPRKLGVMMKQITADLQREHESIRNKAIAFATDYLRRYIQQSDGLQGAVVSVVSRPRQSYGRKLVRMTVTTNEKFMPYQGEQIMISLLSKAIVNPTEYFAVELRCVPKPARARKKRR